MNRVDINKRIIIDFMKREKLGYTIGELTRNLMDDLLYISEISARVSIGNLMKRLEKEHKVYHENIAPTKGAFEVKMWYLKDGLQNIPVEN